MRNKFNKIKSHLLQTIDYSFNTSFSQPELFYLKITENCNFKCRNCDIWKQNSENKKEINWEQLIDNLSTLQACKSITLSGGEPLLSPNFWEIVNLLKDKGIKISLNTNGYLIDKETSQKLAASISKVEISLYSLNADTYNELRQVPNAHTKVLQAIDFLQQANPKLEIFIAFLMTPENIHEATEVIKYFSKKNIWVSLQPLDTPILQLDQDKEFQPEDFDKLKSQLASMELKKTKSLFNELFALKKQGYKIHNRLSQLKLIQSYYLQDFDKLKIPCFAGVKNFIISNTGDVYSCFKGPKIGNLLDQTGKEIWKSNTVRKQMKQCNRYCRIMNCNYRPSLTNKIIEYIK